MTYFLINKYNWFYRFLFLFLFSNQVNSYNNNINFNNNFKKTEINPLDDKNIKNLEKLFYLRNNKYSPYKSIIYSKYKSQNINVTQILEELKNDDEENNKFQDQKMKEFEEAFNQTDNIIENNLFDQDENHEVIKRMKTYAKEGKASISFPGIHVKRMKLKKFDGTNNGTNDIYINDEYDIDINDEDDIDINDEDDEDYDVYENFRNLAVNQQKTQFQYGMKSNNDDKHNFEVIKNNKFNFSSIGGYSNIKDELNQVLDLLHNKKKYEKFNVRIPRGLIFEGPPGNGKTLLAKGFCGEANMSFIAVSGSEFTEKYVGVGASRIRELFETAKENSPCIIFIDEMDALARKRGNDMANSNSEKDETLNQLLINMDGFDNENDIFVIGSTNRIDLLDNALLRPGRMDKKVYIGNPDSETRKEILKIHLYKKPIDKLINIDSIVEMTGGYSGAQIENLLNEVMLYVLRNNRELIEWSDLEYINNRILSGWQDKESKFSTEIIDRIIVHELGHAIVGFLCKDHANVMKVVLNMNSPTSPGYTVFENNDEDSNIYTKDGLISHLMVLLGGRIAEEIYYGYSVTSGAKQDLERAYELSKTMIINYGMGEKNIYPDLSDKSKYLIDQEISKVLMEANEMSYKIIKENKNVIDSLIEKLKEKKLLVPKDIYDAMDINTNKSKYFYENNQYYRLLKEKI